MFFYEGYVCPVCKKKFEETDDIVACPDCGAPHHRVCWVQNGQCRYAEDHGTPRQWKRPEESDYTQPYSNPSAQDPNPPVQGPNHYGQVRTCSRCGKVNPEFAEYCSRCGMALKPPDWSSAPGRSQNSAGGPQYGGPPPYQGGYGEYTPFHMPIMDPFGGIAHDEKIDDIAAEDLVTFIGPNSAYYLPRFYKMSHNGAHASWNWVAFLFTPYWLLYRKNYLAGSILLFLSLISTLINSYILGFYIQPALDMSSNEAMYNSMYSLVQDERYTIYFLILSLLFIASLLVRIIFGLTGNWLYKHTAVGRIRRISEKTGMDRAYGDLSQNTSIVADYRRELSVQGGVSLILVAVASGIVWFGQLLYSALFLYS